jgi:hypothetical protein
MQIYLTNGKNTPRFLTKQGKQARAEALGFLTLAQFNVKCVAKMMTIIAKTF